MRYALMTAVLALTIQAVASPVTRAEESTDIGTPPPRAVVEEQAQDLGTVTKNRTAAARFEVRNEGGAALEILDAVSDCGCVAFDYDRRIPPGKSAEIALEIDTTFLQGPSEVKVEVRTSAPEAATIRFEVTLDVKSYLAAIPGHARFLFTQGEEPGGVDQTVGSLDGEPFEVVRVETPVPFIEASYDRLEEGEGREEFEGPQWRVVLSLQPPVPVGPIQGFATIHTTHPEQETLNIPLSGFTRPVAHITPPEGEFGELEISDEPVKATFVIHNFTSKLMEVTEVEQSVPGVTTELKTVQEGRKFTLTLTFDPAGVEEGPFEETMVVHTSNEIVGVIEIPLHGTIVRTD